MNLVEQHSCDFLPKQTVSIHKAENGTYPNWLLTIYREATEEDLEENHHLEDVGDLMWQTEVSINHCPYCGERLPAKTTSVNADNCFASNWHSQE